MQSRDSDSSTSADELPPAGLLRRFAAMVYDGLLVLAVLMIVTACFLPFTGGEGANLLAGLGLALMAAAVAAILYIKRRQNRE